MQRIGMTWRVDPQHWEAYKEIHLNPWPELLEAIQDVGISNYSIFAFGRRVFAYLEYDGDDDVQNALDRLSQTEIKKKWDEEVTVWVLPQAEDGNPIQFLELEQIFYCP